MPLDSTSLSTASLADVLNALASKNLSPTRRRDLCSAVKRFAGLVGEPLDRISAHPRDLAKLLARIEPARVGLSAKSLQNLKSDLLAAVAASGLQAVHRNVFSILTPAWMTTWGQLPEPRLRIGLSRLAKWCSGHGIEPDAVDDQVLDQFFVELEEGSFVPKVKDLRRSVPRLWNIAAATVPGWPSIRLTVLDRRRVPWTARIDSLPPSFAGDLEAYLRWCAAEDPLDPGARPRRLAEELTKGMRSSIRVAAAAALEAGIPASGLTSLAALVNPEDFREILRYLNKRAGNAPSFQVRGVAKVLTGMAKDWAKLPSAELDALQALSRKLPSHGRGLTIKNKTLLRQFDNPDLVSRLVELPERLWRQALSMSRKPRQALVMAQLAIIIELLLHAPIRRKNLLSLQFGRHISWPSGGKGPAHLHLPAAETKNSRDYEAELGEPLSSMLWHYRKVIVPTALGHRSDFVLISLEDRAKSDGTLHQQFKKTMQRELGLNVSLHQLRHICAKLLLDANPGAHEVVRELLGDASIRTIRDYYVPTDTRRAVKFNDEVIAELREKARSSRPRKGHRAGRSGRQS